MIHWVKEKAKRRSDARDNGDVNDTFETIRCSSKSLMYALGRWTWFSSRRGDYFVRLARREGFAHGFIIFADYSEAPGGYDAIWRIS